MIATPKLVRSLSTRSVKKVEKPKPLKTSPLLASASYSLDDLVTMIENSSQCIYRKNYSELAAIATSLTPKLRIYGQRVEEAFKDLLDKAFVNFRNGCRDEDIDFTTRLNLLHLVELRAMAWHPCAATNQYYLYKGSSAEEPSDGNVSPQLVGNQLLLLNPGEVIKSSGKFSTPTKMPGKNYCKDEVVIRNADSGKVMGIRGRRVHMIEELSETVISFQRVNQGAKERLVQITGQDSERIELARQLIEDTIKRNASPVRELEKDTTGSTSSLNSSASEDSTRFMGSQQEWKYTHTVHHQGKALMMACADLEFLQEAMLKLEKSLKNESEILPNPPKWSLESHREPLGAAFNCSSPTIDLPKGPTSFPKSPSPPKLTKEKRVSRESPVKEKDLLATAQNAPVIPKVAKPEYRYNREFLLECSCTAPSLQKPSDYQKILQEFPHIIRTVTRNFEPIAYVNKWKDVQVSTVDCPAGDVDSD